VFHGKGEYRGMSLEWVGSDDLVVRNAPLWAKRQEPSNLTRDIARLEVNIAGRLVRIDYR